MRKSIRITAGALALAVGMTGATQAEPFNIFSASKAQQVQENGVLEDVGRRHFRRHRHHRGFHPGAAFALGTIGTIAGIAAYNSHRRYYCDPYYEYCGPRRVYRRHYYEPHYYAPRRYYHPYW